STSALSIISPPSFFHRQPSLLPGRDTAGKIRHARVAVLLKRRERFRRALAAVAIDDHWPVLALRELAGGRIEARERQVFGAEHMSGGVLRRIAHVDDE